MPRTGRCLCGSVTLAIDGEPLGARTCWCRDCQKFGGGNGTTNAFFRAAEVSHSGPMTWYESTADSGNRTRRGFCSLCGSHLFTASSGAPVLQGVRLGALDDSDLIAPQAVIWTDSAPSWAALDPSLPHFPTAPPPPPALGHGPGEGLNVDRQAPSLHQRAWGTWRTCLAWGLATLLISQSFNFVMPQAMAHPIAGAQVENPVLAFEFARTGAHLDGVFGARGDPLRLERIAMMIRGNLLDYLFMVVYGSFVLAFFGATVGATGDRRWWLAGWLGPLAALSDAIENALLLSITADMETPAPELAWLPWPVWTKFGLLALACGLAGWSLMRQRAWILVPLCLPAPLAIGFGLAAPLRSGEAAVSAIALGWIAMLIWAGWRTWRDRGAREAAR